MDTPYHVPNPEYTVHQLDIYTVLRSADYQRSYRRGRDKNGFVYVSRGTAHYTFFSDDTEPITVNSGEIIFIPQGTVYRHYVESETEFKVVQFQLLTGTLPAYLSSPTKISTPNTIELTEAFFVPHMHNKIHHSFYYISCLYRLLWRVEQFQSKSSAKLIRIQPAMKYINENFLLNEPVSTYANLCQMSETTFRQVFREYNGRSPVEYRNNLRLQAARTMLKSGKYSIFDTAEQCGFTNHSFFTRLYKKRFGHLPSEE